MKFMRLYAALLLLILGVGCGQQQKATEEASAEESAAETEQATEDNLQLTSEQLGILQESIFFHLRENVARVDDNTFVKHEALMLNGDKLEYLIVVIDRSMLNPIAQSKESEGVFKLASFKQDLPNSELGDTIRVEATISIAEVNTSVEASVNSLKVNISGEYSTSILSSSPYSYNGWERQLDNTQIDSDLVVKLTEPRIYNRDELYLKARVWSLTQADLDGLSADELAYLRNEIFARHGHQFKTDKMKDYFSGKDWYQPFFDDATPFLNDLEKSNAQFIKSLES